MCDPDETTRRQARVVVFLRSGCVLAFETQACV